MRGGGGGGGGEWGWTRKLNAFTMNLIVFRYLTGGEVSNEFNSLINVRQKRFRTQFVLLFFVGGCQKLTISGRGGGCLKLITKRSRAGGGAMTLNSLVLPPRLTSPSWWFGSFSSFSGGGSLSCISLYAPFRSCPSIPPLKFGENPCPVPPPGTNGVVLTLPYMGLLNQLCTSAPRPKMGPKRAPF